MIGEKSVHAAREKAEAIAVGCNLSYAALVVSSMVLGFEMFR